MEELETSTDEGGGRRRKAWPLGGLSALVIVVAVAAVLLLRDEPPPSPPGITAPSPGNPPGSAAPDFSVELLGGGTFALFDHLADDGRPVLLNLWASWCTPCRAEMPELDAASRTHTGVYFLGVAVEDDPTAAREFASEIGVGYPLAIDEGDRVGRRYPSFGLPATYLIGSDGTIVRTVYGQVTADQLAELLATVE